MSLRYLMLLLLIVLFKLCFGADNSTVIHHDHQHVHHGHWDCDRRWPALTMLVPIGLKNGSARNSEWTDIFLHSMSMFWPIKRSNVSLVVMVDSELKGDQLLSQFVEKPIADSLNKTNVPPITLKFHEPQLQYHSGHDRQQHLMFYGDKFVDTDYIGFGDSDCLFYTNIDREDLFEDGKPVIHGRIGYVRKIEVPKSKWPAVTWSLLGEEEPMICMSYFPVIIRASHLKDMRDFIEKKFGQPFDKTFENYMSGKAFSQFNIMCAYLWYHKKAEYRWYIHDTSPWWDGNNPTPMFAQWSMRWIYDPPMFALKPFVTLHVRYRFTAAPLLGNPTNVNELLLKGQCVTSPQHNMLGLNCTQYFAKHPYFDEMYKFEDADYNQVANHTEMTIMQENRRRRFVGCDLSYGKDEITAHFAPFGYDQNRMEELLNK